MSNAIIILVLGLGLLIGLMLSRLAKLLGLPAVTGYLIAGILLGPYVLGRLGIEGLGFTSYEEVKSLKIVNEVAIGFIAFTISNEFKLTELKKIGKQATAVAVLGAVMATVVVDVALLIVHFIVGDDILPISAVLTLGAIAAATDPAATLMVCQQYKAKGPITSILLPVVALDDAVGLIIFALSFGVAQSFTGGVSIVNMLVEPILEIVLSLAIGGGLGFLFTWVEKLFHSRSKRLAVSVMFVFLTIAISSLSFTIGSLTISFSTLLSCMMLGTVFCNTCETSDELMDRINRWTSPLFILFFVLSGAELQFDILANIIILVIGLVYIISRCIGKYSGAFMGAALTKCPKTVDQYLGLTLFPQAGVALGMSLNALNVFPSAEGQLIRNIVLFGVLIYELLGPTITKITLLKAGEIIPENRVSQRKPTPSN